MFKELFELKVDVYQLVVLTLFATVFPGLLILFEFKREFAMSLDVVTRLALAGAITLPFVMLNTFLGLAINDGVDKSDGKRTEYGEAMRIGWLVGCLFSGFMFAGVIAVQYFQAATFRDFAIALMITQAGVAALMIAIAIGAANQKPKSKDSQASPK